MNTHDPQTLIVLLLIAVAVIAAVIFAVRQQKIRESRHLRKRFGPEYARVVETVGDRDRAEAELKAREKRVARLQLATLPAAEASRFSQAWEKLQSRFVDNPREVVAEADRLVRELMLKRGYPMGDFDSRAADISVHHPVVVEHYRAAQLIAERDTRGHASTEDLRKAIVHYRVLFDDLLEVARPDSSSPTASSSEMAVHS